MWTCVKWEWRRQLRQARFWGALLALGVLGILFTYGYSQMHSQPAVAAILGPGRANGFYVPIVALSLSSSVMLPFFVSLLSGDGISGERQVGTWAMLLTQGVSPWSLYAAKWFFTVGYAFLATACLVLTSFVGGMAVFGLHGALLPSGVETTRLELLRLLGIMTLYAAAGQMVVATLALLVSAFCRYTLSAIMITMGGLLFMAMLGDMPFWAGAQKVFFTGYFARVMDALTFPPDWTAMTHGLIVYGLYVVFLWAAILWFEPFRE